MCIFECDRHRMMLPFKGNTMTNKPTMPAAITLSEILALRSRVSVTATQPASLTPIGDQFRALQPTVPAAAAKNEAEDIRWVPDDINIANGKSSIHLRLDTDVLVWFKSQGKGHLTRMNAVLRAYMQAKKARS